MAAAAVPTHIELAAQNYGLTRDSVVLLEQIRTLDKRRLREKMGRVDKELMDRVDAAIAVSFGLQGRATIILPRSRGFYTALQPKFGGTGRRRTPGSLPQGGVRPVLIVQNDTGNRYSPTVIVAAITSGLTLEKARKLLLKCADYTRQPPAEKGDFMKRAASLILALALALSLLPAPCRPQPGCRERAGRRPSRADRSKRYREPIQPHGHRGGHHQPDGKGEAAHPHRIGSAKLWTYP